MNLPEALAILQDVSDFVYPACSDAIVAEACAVVRHQLTPEVMDLLAELHRADEKWGGPSHDDQHSPNTWHALVRDYNGWARTMAGMGSLDKARRRWIQTAGLALNAAAVARRQTSRGARP